MRTIIIVIVLAAVSCAAVPANSLATPQWLVEGTTLTGSESVKLKGETAMKLKTVVTGGANFILQCAKVIGALVVINNVLHGKAEKVSFEECKVTEPATCKISSPTISTGPVVTELFDEGTTEVWNSLVPETGTEFTKITVTGCAGEGIYKITGKTCGKIIEPGASAKVKLTEYGTNPLPESEACQLKMGVNKATLEGTAESELVSGKLWTADF